MQFLKFFRFYVNLEGGVLMLTFSPSTVWYYSPQNKRLPIFRLKKNKKIAGGC